MSARRAGKGSDSWKAVEVEYGADSFEVQVPGDCAVLAMKEVPPLGDPEARMRESIRRPIGSRALPEILKAKGKPIERLRVCITTSDITRPVPYKGKTGILPPLLALLHEAGVRKEQITLLVGTGTHRPSTAEEKVAMFGPEVAAEYRIVDHDCDYEPGLVDIGKTRTGTPILVNRTFYESDVKIATALVESHFMAGASGGRKAVCPALVSRKTIERFHSGAVLDSPTATNLVLEGNPCHEEALEIATAAGVDFIVNTVLNRRLQLIEAFSGDLLQAHAQAVALLKQIVAIPAERIYDVVLTHGGYVGINHYQNAKAAVNALPILRDGGILILAACERDSDPIGPLTYRTLLHLLKLQGADAYLAALMQPSWRFTRDQWEPQMWGKVLKQIGEEGLLYCSSVLRPELQELVPGRLGWEFLPAGAPTEGREAARSMTQEAIRYAVTQSRSAGGPPAMAFISEGPYAVPFPRS